MNINKKSDTFEEGEVLIEVKNLKQYFSINTGFLKNTFLKQLMMFF